MRSERAWVGVLATAVAVLTLTGVASAAAWKQQSVPLPQVPNGTLDAISCKFGSCVAVGGFSGPRGVHVGLAERSIGTQWTTLHPLNPAGGNDTELSGVSCPAAQTCFAVGRYVTSGSTVHESLLIERWNGSGWEVQDTSPDSEAGLTAVSCTSPTSCMAVGVSGDSLLAERWDGTSWTGQSLPSPTNVIGEALSGVSCSSPSACTAVGSYSTASGSRVVDQPLVERWDGGSWSLETAPLPAGTNSGVLSAVSCPFDKSCFAVGNTDAGAKVPVLERWNGTRWSLQMSPRAHAAMADVSCAGNAACTAVGTTAGNRVAMRWNGTSWANQTVLAASGSTGLLSVSCATQTSCAAVGSEPTTDPPETFELVRWDGSHWGAETPEKPQGGVTIALNGVSCPSSTSCEAVGAGNGPLAEAWSPSGWSIDITPTPAGAQSSAFNGVSCVTGGACAAAGQYTDSSGTQRPLIGTLSAGTWSIAAVALPAGATAGVLEGISCPSASSCIAVGNYTDASDVTRPLAERLHGGVWSSQTPPSAAGETNVVLNAISCTSASACQAVGGTGEFDGSIVEGWNGTAWSLETAPDPGGQGFSRLSAVSCPAQGDCLAGGDFVSGVSRESFFSSWDGAAWSTTTAAPFVSELFAASCASHTWCAAVGTVYQPFDETPGLEEWNGTKWTNPTIPKANVPGALQSVSCDDSGDCTAVGTISPVYTVLPLIVRRAAG